MRSFELSDYTKELFFWLMSDIKFHYIVPNNPSLSSITASEEKHKNRITPKKNPTNINITDLGEMKCGGQGGNYVL